MKIGSCLLMLATQADPLAKTSIPLLKSAGYDYAEVPLARLWSLDDKEIEAYRGLFVQNGLPVEAFNNSVSEGLALVGPDADPKVLDAYIGRALDLAGRMGAKVINMCGPTRDSVPVGYRWEDGFGPYVEFLKRYADAAAASGVTLALEPINSEENGFLSTVGEALEVVRACGRGNLKLVVDFYHFFKQGDSWERLLEAVGDGVAHVHYATRSARAYPLEKDEAECRAALEPILSAGYRGRVSIEARTAHPEEDLPQTLALLRKWFA